MARVSFYLAAKQAEGLSEVRVRFTATKINRRAATHIFAPVALWNESDGRLSISKRYETPQTAYARKVQAQLDSLADKILSAYYHDKNAPLHDDWLETIIAPPIHNKPALHEVIEQYCDSRNVAPATRRKLRALGTHIREFSRLHGNMYADEITARDLERFFAYLMQNGKCQNSAATRLRQLRSLVYWHGKPYPNPFEQFTIPADLYGDPIYLTKLERDIIAHCDKLSLAQRRQRDIFIFQCHTGCRVGDLYRLTANNIREGWLVYTPRKTARNEPRSVEVPLTQTALQIVERYSGCDVRGRLLPFISEPKYNRAIQKILRACGITRPVMVFNPHTFDSSPVPICDVATSHTARKTFIQIAYAATGDKRLVAAMSGHSENSTAFNRYSEVSREMKEKTIQAVE